MVRKSEAIRIFVVEDDPMYNRMVKYIMELNPDHEVYSFATGEECIRNLHLGPSIVSLDYSLADKTGEEVLLEIKKFNSEIDVVILSGQQDVSTAVNLLKLGAYDYITKDAETKERLINTITHLKNKNSLVNEVAMLKNELKQNYAFDSSLIGKSPAMQSVFQLMEKSVKTDITISITGETGTGKEMIAKSIHYNSKRNQGPLVSVNMSAIPNNLLESELFGYEKGAFTGANTRKIGQFEQADKGTLFLDEIGEMDINLQAKVLRAIQEREVMRVGGEKPIPFDARIVVATHRDLAEEVEAGNFREDLYYRLLGLPIHLPPLRDRGNDIILLARHFLDDFSKKNDLGDLELSNNAIDKLLNYSFPGNVRELKAIIDLGAVMANKNKIDADDIRFNSVKRKFNLMEGEATFRDYKIKILSHYLNKYNNDVLKVAEILDIGKSTIYRLIKEFDKELKA